MASHFDCAFVEEQVDESEIAPSVAKPCGARATVSAWSDRVNTSEVCKRGRVVVGIQTRATINARSAGAFVDVNVT